MSALKFGLSAAGTLIMLAGIFFGLWLTVLWGWIGGITNLIDAAKATPVESYDVAVSIVRIVFAGAIGGFVGWVIVSLGVMIASLGK